MNQRKDFRIINFLNIFIRTKRRGKSDEGDQEKKWDLLNEGSPHTEVEEESFYN